MKKKKGSTLIEMMVVIFMVLILLSIPISAYLHTGIINDVTIKSIEHDISNILSFAKQYCYYTGNNGKLEVDKRQGKISFIDTKDQFVRKVVATITLPKGISFVNGFDISVSNKGVISSKTIELYDSKGEKHKVTITVGTDLITIY